MLETAQINHQSTLAALSPGSASSLQTAPEEELSLQMFWFSLSVTPDFGEKSVCPLRLVPAAFLLFSGSGKESEDGKIFSPSPAIKVPEAELAALVQCPPSIKNQMIHQGTSVINGHEEQNLVIKLSVSCDI